MSEKDIIWLLGIAFGFAAGFSLGHLQGQSAGIKWYRDTCAPIDRAVAALHLPQDSTDG